jgi:hypothetical protein
MIKKFFEFSESKLFEEYSLKSVNGWGKISAEDCYDFDLKYNYDVFTKKDSEEVIDLFVDDIMVRYKSAEINIKSPNYNYDKNNWYQVNITKYEDDWYIVFYYSSSMGVVEYYLCDQLDMLLGCLVSLGFGDNIIKESVGDDSGIYSMDKVEYYRFKKKRDNFIKDEIVKIKSILTKMGFMYEFNVNSIKIETDKYRLDITKYEDEWYLVKKVNKVYQRIGISYLDGEFYKCDQFDALIKYFNSLVSHYIKESVDELEGIEELSNYREWAELDRKKISLSKHEVMSIIELLNGPYLTNIYPNIPHVQDGAVTYKNNDNFIIRITKYDDDWFTFQVSRYNAHTETYTRRIWVCDQLDSVLRMVKYSVKLKYVS